MVVSERFIADFSSYTTVSIHLRASLSIRPACEQLLSPPSLGIVVWWILRRHVRHLSGAALPFTYVASFSHHLCALTHILHFISALHGDTCNLIVLSIYFTEFLTAKSWTQDHHEDPHLITTVGQVFQQPIQIRVAASLPTLTTSSPLQPIS